jgi:hypothetical protein
LLLMWGEGGLPAEFDAFGFRIGPASRCPLRDAAALKFRGNAEHRKDKLSKIGCGIDNRLGNLTQARPGALVGARITGIGAGDVVHLILIDYASIPPSVIR